MNSTWTGESCRAIAESSPPIQAMYLPVQAKCAALELAVMPVALWPAAA